MAERGKKAVVPKLRFPEFRGCAEWKSERMDSLYSFMRNNTLSRDKLNYAIGTVKNIHYGDIHTKFSTLFDITKELVPYINGTEELPNTGSDDYCVEGDIIFADSSEDMNDVGKSIEILRLEGQLLLAGQHTILARRKDDELVLGFGGHVFQSPRVRSQIQHEAQGTKVYAISPTRLARIEVAYPGEEEQQKIADCLTSLDELISAQGRKVEALKTYKRGLMQQLFPREGETLPRLRFPEFRDAPEWRRFEVQEFSEVIRGASPRPQGDPRYFGGTVPRLMGSDVARDGKWVTPQVDFLTDEGAKLSRPCEKGTLTVICSGDVGVPSFLSVDACIHDGFLALRNIDTAIANPEFIYYCLFQQREKFQTSATQGGVFVNLTTTIMREFSISLPEIVEQQRVASLLSEIDVFIASESCKHRALIIQKKGLMQQLFPSFEEA